MNLKSTDPRDYEASPHGLAATLKEFPADSRVPSHVHGRAQLIYATSGVMEVTTADGLWLLPPQRALWMLDETEGADLLMVKPGLAYLDVLARLRDRTLLPLACYHSAASTR